MLSSSFFCLCMPNWQKKTIGMHFALAYIGKKQYLCTAFYAVNRPIHG